MRLSALGLAAWLLAGCDIAPARTKFTVAWSTYASRMPWGYAEESGILRKWAEAYGIEIELVQLGYRPSVQAWVDGEADAAAMTNLEALNMPAAAMVDSTVIILGSYSNGNDAILTRGVDLDALPGQTVQLAARSTSHYLLVRALDLQGFFASEVEVEDLSDAEIAAAFLSERQRRVVVTWNPIAMQIESSDPGVERIFSSSNVPGEILDLMVARTGLLAEHPELAEALTGAWYEVMALLEEGGAEAEAAFAAMASRSNYLSEDFARQFESTAFFYHPDDAVDYLWDPRFKDRMSFIVDFCFEHELLGEGVGWANAVGIRYPDGTVRGNAQNVKLRFDDTYMQKAADGELRSTRAQAAKAQRAALELAEQARQLFGPLPEVAGSKSNPVTEAKIELGRMLYYDSRLSKGNDISCNSCHPLDRFGVDRQPVSIGHLGQRGERNAPTVYNAALQIAQFWDGRASNVEEQAKAPLLSPTEMAMGSAEEVVAVLESIPGYAPFFEAAFPAAAEAISFDHVAQAIGAFERRLMTPSRFDAFISGDAQALTAAEQEGLRTFVRIGCPGCHTGRLVGGGTFRKLGRVVALATDDPGRADATGDASESGYFKVPSLRNVHQTAPYFHDGSITTLEEAVRIMARHQLGHELSDAELAAIVAFLGTLTGTVDETYVARPRLAS